MEQPKKVKSNINSSSCSKNYGTNEKSQVKYKFINSLKNQVSPNTNEVFGQIPAID